MSAPPHRSCREPAPTLSDDDRALLRPQYRHFLGASYRWGREDDEPTPPVTDAEVDDVIDWMWSRAEERPYLRAAIAEARAERHAD